MFQTSFCYEFIPGYNDCSPHYMVILKITGYMKVTNYFKECSKLSIGILEWYTIRNSSLVLKESGDFQRSNFHVISEAVMTVTTFFSKFKQLHNYIHGRMPFHFGSSEFNTILIPEGLKLVINYRLWSSFEDYA